FISRSLRANYATAAEESMRRSSGTEFTANGWPFLVPVGGRRERIFVSSAATPWQLCLNAGYTLAGPIKFAFTCNISAILFWGIKFTAAGVRANFAGNCYTRGSLPSIIRARGNECILRRPCRG